MLVGNDEVKWTFFFEFTSQITRVAAVDCVIFGPRWCEVMRRVWHKKSVWILRTYKCQVKNIRQFLVIRRDKNSTRRNLTPFSQKCGIRISNETLKNGSILKKHCVLSQNDTHFYWHVYESLHGWLNDLSSLFCGACNASFSSSFKLDHKVVSLRGSIEPVFLSWWMNWIDVKMVFILMLTWDGAGCLAK